MARVDRCLRPVRPRKVETGSNSSDTTSEALRCLKEKALCELRNSILRYRQLAFQLRQERRQPDNGAIECNDLHMGLSLKHTHIYNDIAHLILLDDLLKQQSDLFGL